MSVTAKDVAKVVQLSQPTVSRILNGDASHRISIATRQRVMETAIRLGYQPNAIARSLKRGRTNIIGLYTNHDYDARNDFFGTIIGGLQRACAAHRLDLLLHSALPNDSPDAMYGKLRDGRIDGLILHARTTDPLVQRLGQSPLPVVALADPTPGLPSVTCDDVDGMRQLIASLWERGWQRYVFLSPPDGLASVERRKKAYQMELERLAVSEDCRTVLTIDYEHADAALDTLLEGDRKVAVCWNDRSAYNLLRACLQRGVKVPEEIGVTGFDGFLDDKAPARQLVTVHCPWDQAAARALSLLIEMIECKNAVPITTDEVCLPVRLMTGDTA